MAGQFKYSIGEAGQKIIKAIMETKGFTSVAQLAETLKGVSYSGLNRIYNGETKEITIPVYTALKEAFPDLRDEFLKTGERPIYENDEIFTAEAKSVDLIKMQQDLEKKMAELQHREVQLNERARILDSKEAKLRAYIESLEDVIKRMKENF